MPATLREGTSPEELSHYMPLLDAATAAGVRLVAGFPTPEAARRIIQDPASEDVTQPVFIKSPGASNGQQMVSIW